MTTQPIPNRTSLVPHYTFADTLAEQEAQLKVNPLMQRLIAAGRVMPTIRIVRSITTSTQKIRSTIPTAFASGRGAGISSIKPIRPKTRANIGAMP